MKIDVYLHNEAEHSEIVEELQDQEIPEHLLNQVAEEIINFTYEVKLEFDLDLETGKIKFVKIE